MSEYTLYTKATCKYCTMAKNLLKKHGRTYTEVIIDDYPGLREMIRAAGYTTVPIIFRVVPDGRGSLGVGGYTTLLEELEPPTDNPAD